MKVSKMMIAATMIAVLPLSAFAGDKEKTETQMSSAASAQFNALDTNRDGRISQTEASTDTKLVFSTADKNGDGYLDNREYAQRDMSKDSMPEKTPQ